jgi:hypothetical protein
MIYKALAQNNFMRPTADAIGEIVRQKRQDEANRQLLASLAAFNPQSNSVNPGLQNSNSGVQTIDTITKGTPLGVLTGVAQPPADLLPGAPPMAPAPNILATAPAPNEDQDLQAIGNVQSAQVPANSSSANSATVTPAQARMLYINKANNLLNTIIGNSKNLDPNNVSLAMQAASLYAPQQPKYETLKEGESMGYFDPNNQQWHQVASSPKQYDKGYDAYGDDGNLHTYMPDGKGGYADKGIKDYGPAPKVISTGDRDNKTGKESTTVWDPISKSYMDVASGDLKPAPSTRININNGNTQPDVTNEWSKTVQLNDRLAQLNSAVEKNGKMVIPTTGETLDKKTYFQQKEQAKVDGKNSALAMIHKSGLLKAVDAIRADMQKNGVPIEQALGRFKQHNPKYDDLNMRYLKDYFDVQLK